MRFSRSPLTSRQQHWLAVTGLALFPLLFFYRALWIGSHTLLGNWDASAQSFAWYAKIARALQEGSFPFWDFYTDSGTYFPGELQTAAFYPPNWLFALVFDPADLQGMQFWAELYSVLHVSLCAVLTYLFLRELKLALFPAIFGALLCSLFGAMAERITAQPNIHAGMVYVPGVLFMLQRAWNQQEHYRSLLSASLAGLLLGCCILAGHLYSYIHAALLAFLLLMFSCGTKISLWPKALRLLAVLGISSLLVSAVQIGPTLEYFRRAMKWYSGGITAYPHVVPFEAFASWAFSSWETMLTWRCSSDCSEHRTLYVGLTALPLAVLAVSVNRFARVVIVPIIAVVLLVATAGDNLAGAIVYRIPVLDNVRVPSRILFVYPLLIAVLAGIGLQYLLERCKEKRALQAVVLACVGIAFGGDLYQQQQNWQVTGIPREIAPWNPADYYADPVAGWLRTNLQGSLYRWVAEPNDLLPPNYGHVGGINGARGHRSSMLENYYDVLGGYLQGGGWQPRTGTKYVVRNVEDRSMQQVFSAGGKYIYVLPGALPIVHALSSGVHKEIPVSDVRWTTNTLTVTLDERDVSAAGERLFFGLVYYPGWNLRVNGEARELRARTLEDGAFMSATLLPGDREIELAFFPQKMYRACFCLVLFGGWLIYLYWRIMKSK